MTRFCLDRTLALALYAGFAACGDGGDLQPCDPSPDPIVGAPRITGMSPTSGPPGTTVTLTGIDFDQGPDVHIEAVYGDYSVTCDHGYMLGNIDTDNQITVTIPEEANVSGYIYLLVDGLTVARSPQPFRMDQPGIIVVNNLAQFPIVTATANDEPALDAGDRIDVEEVRPLEVAPGPVYLQLCVGGRDASGATEPWACVVHETRIEAGVSTDLTVAELSAARFLEGDWIATWEVGEDETEEELLHIDGDGRWQARQGRGVVEDGQLVAPAGWTPYRRDFTFQLRPGDPDSETTVPVTSFSVLSPRAGGRVEFYRAE